MQTLVDIPDPVYRALKVCADSEGATIEEIILDGVAVRLRSAIPPEMAEKKPRFPVLHSHHPGSLRLGEEGVYEYIPFP
jgi:hypothetical protein